MFGSLRQPELMGTHENERVVLLAMPAQLPAVEAAQQLVDMLASYEGDKSALLLGYWDYGAEIVVTAPKP